MIHLHWVEVPTVHGMRSMVATLPSVHRGVAGVVVIRAEARQHYCDRGRWLVHVDGAVNLDGADMFPRYYFELGAMKGEMEAWANARSETTKAHQMGLTVESVSKVEGSLEP